MRRAGSVLLSMALVTAACSGGGDASPAVAGDATGGSPTSSSVPDEFDAFFSEIPAIPDGVSVAPGSIDPGDVITISGVPVGGSLTHFLPDGSVVELGTASGELELVIPSDAPEGRHGFLATTPSGLPSVASVVVRSGPFVSIRVDRGSVVTEAFGADPTAGAILQVGSGDSARYLEGFAGVGLIPVALEPESTLADFVAGPLPLPPGVDGDLTLAVLDGAGEDFALTSNTVRRSVCAEPARVTGEMAGPGDVRALWGAVGGSVTVASDGPYEIEVGAGLVAVVEAPFAGEPVTHFVRAGCGRSVDTRDDASTGIGSFTPDGLGVDTWVGEVAGAIDLLVEDGLAICDEIDGAIEVILFDELDFTVGVSATIDPFSGTGTYSTAAIFFDPSGGFHEFPLDLAVVAEGESITGSFAGSVDLDAGATLVEGAFHCGLSAPSAFDGGPGLFASYQTGGGHGQCRIGMVIAEGDARPIGFAAARRLADGVPLVEWSTSHDYRTLLEASARDQLLGGTGDDLFEGARRLIGGDYFVWVEVRSAQIIPDQPLWLIIKAIDQEKAQVVARYARSGATVEELTALPEFDGFVADVAAAGICGFVDPTEASLAAGEEQAFSYEVVDLADEVVVGASISVADREDRQFDPACGEVDPLEGSSGFEPFVATFTAAEEVAQDCSEYPGFSAELATPSGSIETRAHRERGDATVHVGSRWDFFAELRAELPDGPQSWKFGTQEDPGFFFVRETGLIVGGASGTFDGFRSCEVYENGVLTFKEPPVAVSGTWTTWIHGRRVDDAQRYFDFRLEGGEWSSNWPPLPDRCLDPLLSDVGEGVLELFAYHAAAALVHPLRLTPEQITVEFRVDPEALPNATFTVTIRPSESAE